jgi:tetratricopeptide (TPR) repeat protein
VELVRRLVNSGIPVLAEGWLRPEEDIGHYRIVRGYDLLTDQLLTQDSFHGPDVWVDVGDFEAMWRPFFSAYAPLYRAEQEPLVAALVGADWEDADMAAGALHSAREATVSSPEDPIGWYNLGDAFYLQGDAEAAIVAYERSVELGLPPRFFWYRFDFFAALNALGYFERVVELTDPLLAEVASLAELQIQRGHALAALGQKEDAIAAFRQAERYVAYPEPLQAVVAELLRSDPSA